ncbi:MAG: hypothetical protein P8Y53_18595 [Pseudolabrys sp.]
MSDRDSAGVRIFSVITRFQELARRAGGVPRDKAIANAQAKIEEIKPGFDDWVTRELQALADTVEEAKSGKARPDWVESANRHCRQLRDVGTTMDFELLTYIADSLCEIFDGITAGAECNMESIACHLDALFLVRQRGYRGMKPEQVPELTQGLRRVVEHVSTSPD